MRIPKTLLPATLALGCLFSWGAALGQQASFAVAVTLHTTVKSASPAQLCARDRETQVVGAAIRIDCPVLAQTKAGAAAQAADPETRSPRQTEVTVTF